MRFKASRACYFEFGFSSIIGKQKIGSHFFFEFLHDGKHYHYVQHDKALCTKNVTECMLNCFLFRSGCRSERGTYICITKLFSTYAKGLTD